MGKKKGGLNLKSITKPITSGFKQVGGAFKKVDGAFKKVGEGFKAIESKFKTINNIFECIGNIFKSLFSYLTCGIKFVTNFFTKCWYYYVLDAILGLLGSILRTFAYCIQLLVGSMLSAKDIMYIPNFIYDKLLWLDKQLYNVSKMHFMRYSDATMDACYKCDIKPMPDFKSLGKCGKSSKHGNKKRRSKPIEYVDCDDDGGSGAAGKPPRKQ